MPRGSSIRILLADGAVTGIRHAEVVNWTGQAIACPRNRLRELLGWEEAHRPGMYLLLGADETDGKPAVYIGEAENVWNRLQDHLARKDFWNEVVLFTSKDENLTKAHVRYLESKAYASALAIGRYTVLNATAPQPALLPRGDRDAMESFLEQIRVLLGVLGHRVFEPLAPAARSGAGESDLPAGPAPKIAGAASGTILKLSAKSITANAVLTDEGIVVLAGSHAAAHVADSTSIAIRKLREQLIQDAVLVSEDDRLRFATDHLFSSPSAAGCVIVGYAINGRAAWKSAEGQSISELESSGLTRDT